MFSKVYGATLRGIMMETICIETDIGEGMPVFDMVGLLSSEVKEAKERVLTAIKNSKISIPPKRITINMSPAEIRKEGAYFDLPIAVGILWSLGKIETAYAINEILFIGELGLDGSLKSMKGAISVAIAAREKGFKKIILPLQNAKEASCEEGIEVIGAENLKEVEELLNGKRMPRIIKSMKNKPKEEASDKDFADIVGQESLKRAALIAAAGNHSILFIGPPGSGKTMVSERIATILPQPTYEECIEITKIHSIAGQLGDKDIMMKRPFRKPHHTITATSMIGGGINIKPGEISLAHKGVLFLDELAEFKKDTLESLRQPLEEKKVVISRLTGKYVFPADVMLVAATNPCKCGYYPDRNKCICQQYEVKKYMGRISGPFMNRIDITVGATLMNADEFQKEKYGITSEEMRKRVEAARLIQLNRYKDTGIRYNSEIAAKDIKKYCYLGENEKRILRMAFEKMGISARTYYKTIRVARTIADIEGSLNIRETHIAEAIGYKTV